MELVALKTRLVNVGDDLAGIILGSLKKQRVSLQERDILAVASKVVSIAERRVAKLSDLEPSPKAKKLAKDFKLRPEFAELIIREADTIYGGVERAVLTLKDHVLTANAGIDNKNAPQEVAVLWPSDPAESAERIRREIRQSTGKRVGVVIVDSGLMPLRIGTTAIALAVAGFKPIRDQRGENDLYGRKIIVTRHAVADDIASAAHLIMGEATERTPFVLVRDAPVEFDDAVHGSGELMMPFDECIFIGTLENLCKKPRKG